MLIKYLYTNRFSIFFCSLTWYYLVVNTASRGKCLNPSTVCYYTAVKTLTQNRLESLCYSVRLSCIYFGRASQGIFTCQKPHHRAGLYCKMSILSTVGMAVMYKVTLFIHSCVSAVSQLHSFREKKQTNLQTIVFVVSNWWNIVSEICPLTLTQLVKIPVASELVRIFIMINVLFRYKLSVTRLKRNKKK